VFHAPRYRSAAGNLIRSNKARPHIDNSDYERTDKATAQAVVMLSFGGWIACVRTFCPLALTCAASWSYALRTIHLLVLSGSLS
jgi:hypothetical protein